MEILYLLIPYTMLVVALVVWAIFWAVRNGHFDDLDGPRTGYCRTTLILRAVARTIAVEASGIKQGTGPAGLSIAIAEPLCYVPR